MPWVDDFLGNKLSSKWVTTRYSAGGQNDGVLNRVVANSKVFWEVTNPGTESGYFGQWISLPVNALGDIIVEALVRYKRNIDGFATIGVGFNQSAAGAYIRYGGQVGAPGLGVVSISAGNNFVGVPFPGFPSKTRMDLPINDVVSKIRVIRKNGYIFVYNYGYYIGQYAYAAPITTVDIINNWHIFGITAQRWIDYIKVWPRSVVL